MTTNPLVRSDVAIIASNASKPFGMATRREKGYFILPAFRSS
jgi:hypothetical protein